MGAFVRGIVAAIEVVDWRLWSNIAAQGLTDRANVETLLTQVEWTDAPDAKGPNDRGRRE